MDEDLVTIFRSADPSAREDAEEVTDLLAENGLSPVLVDDSQPGVPSGAWEVRVPAGQVTRADEIIQSQDESPPEPGDPSHDYDLETIFDDMGATAEVEALGVRTVLQANGIQAVMVSALPYPSLRFVVRVPKKDFARARQVLADAQAAGPTTAEEAGATTEE